MNSNTATTASPAPVNPSKLDHWRAYPRFLSRVVWQAFDGNWLFYVWMILLTAVFLVGANA